MASHKNLQYADTKEKPFHCTLCPKSFTRKDLLTRHDRLTHSSSQPREVSYAAATPNITDPRQSVSQGPRGLDAPTVLNPSDTSQSGSSQPLMPSQDLQNLHESSHYLDCVGLPLAAASLPLFDLYCWQMTPKPLNETTNSETVEARTDSTERQAPDLLTFGSRLPSLQPEDRKIEPEPSSKSRAFRTVTQACRENILQYLENFQHLTPGSFTLPSRHALSRFVAGYFIGFHEHYPMIHVPSFQPETTSVDLLLSMAALGAQYCREPEQGLKLFQVAKAVTLARIKLQGGPEPSSGATMHASSPNSARRGEESPQKGLPIEILQCLILFVAISTWFENREIAQEAFSVLSFLAFFIREDGLECPAHHADMAWEEWVMRETIDRTNLIGFCFFNLYTILFSIPPSILSSEINICLPSTEKEWRAESAAEWERVRTKQPRFQEAMRNLFDFQEAGSEGHTHFSSLGGYLLIHGVIQNIWLLQHTPQVVPGRPTLPTEEVEAFERALKRWSGRWERNRESSLDPVGPHGPVPFNSTALLRLAYIRINTEGDTVQSLRSWNPSQIALALHRSPPVQRSGRLTRAALHCAHALSVPIKLGINYVAHTQMMYWSIQHAICALESVSLLSNWLQIVTLPGTELAPDERKVLDFVLQMVAEAQDDVHQAPQRLSTTVVRLWAKLFRPDSVWQMVGLVGRVLEAYADLLEKDDL
ncbi:C2H2 transcription factor [Macrophomina phaseolina]|uniref:C2H2 transcription factor n=1 Tax=Macrophomina phaseolina TaxID=35725 RepID=A0ABQ8G0H3_9PEZI|nr:C2H2 transcription factor [Macrophomina phaseolina]